MTQYYQVMTKDSQVQHYRLVLYGASGVGKTYLSAQFPDPLFLACDPGPYGGLLSVRERAPKYVKIDSWARYKALWPTVKADAGKGYKTLVVDSVTFFRRLIMDDIMGRTAREIPRQDDWNLCIERLRRCVMEWCETPAHLIMICGEVLERDEILGRIVGMPDLPGKMAKQLAHYIDICVHLKAESGFDQKGARVVRRVIQVQPDEWYDAKDRTGTIKDGAPASFEAFAHLFGG